MVFKFQYDLKQITINNQIYILDPLDLEVFHLHSKDDIDTLYKNIILNKRKKIKIKPKYTFDEKNTDINTISLDISHGCTLKCKYCYLSAGYHKKEKMSKDFFLKILNFLNKDKKHDITFYFAGEGEPTLNKPLIMQIPKLCRDNGFNKCHFEITTNGTLLTQDLIKFLEKEKFAISVSLDGDEKNDSNRIFINGNPSFSKVIENITLLKKTKIKFACKATITPDNKDLLQMFRFFEDNEFPFFHGFATRSFDGQYIPKISDVRNNLKLQFDTLIDYYVKRIKDNKYIYARKIIDDIKRIKYRSVSYTGCSAGINSFYINMKGEIYVCSSHNSCQELCVGNISEGIDYEKIIKQNYYPKDVNSYSKCKYCWMRYLCSGGCLATKWLETKTTTNPSEYQCILNSIYWEAIIKIFIQISPYIKGNINFKK